MNTSDVRVPKFVFKDKHINFPGEGSGLRLLVQKIIRLPIRQPCTEAVSNFT